MTLADRSVDLANCESEPIHAPGRVQPHGVLLAFGLDRVVVQVGGDTVGLFATTAQALLGTPADLLVAASDRDALRDALAAVGPKPTEPFLVTTPAGFVCEAVAHRHDGLTFLELEAAGPDTRRPGDIDRLVRFALERLGGETRTTEFCAAAAREVRSLTGFDRVMVYRFDDHWNGEVIAEDRRADLEPYLGLHYPAGDIPPQARRLYAENWIRHIPNITYEASPLVPDANPQTGRPTDLSFSVLRSVSPIHVEYLQNMGVSASLSVSVLKHGRLWGLVACHHYAPRRLPMRVRAACETLGILMSLQLSSRLDAEDLRCRAAAGERLSRLATALADAPDVDVADTLTSRADDLLDLTEARGAAVLSGGRVGLAGDTPPAEAVTAMASWLATDDNEGLFAANAMPADSPLGAHADRAAGVLGVCLSHERGEYLLWFRPEAVREVSWAGDPHHKPLTFGPNGPRLSPRGSFALWREEQRGRSRPWSECEREAADSLRRIVLAALARQAQSLAEELRRKDVFLATLGHELRNPLAPIRSALQVMLLRGTDDPDLRWAAGVVRRQADQMARLVDDLLDVSRVTQGKVRLRKERADLGDILSRAAETSRPLIDAAGQSLGVTMPPAPVALDADPARLAQVFANLLNNASKYTERGGNITLTASVEGTEAVVRVGDNGVGIAPEMLPRLFDLFAQADRSLERSQGGLGVGLSLVRALVGMHGGSVQARSDGPGKGSEFTVRLPLALTREPDAPEEADARPAAVLAGRRVLVVDDNRDAADSLALLLRVTGHQVRTAGDGPAAVEAAEAFRPDVVLLDVGLPGFDGYEAARRIRSRSWGRRVFLVAVTGWGHEEDRRRSEEAGFDRHLVKPVDPEELAILIDSGGTATA